MTSTALHLQDLSPVHVGRTVTIRSEDGTAITGRLWGVNVDTRWIPDQSMEEPEPRMVPGGQTITVQVGRWTCEGLSPLTAVEVSA